MVAWNFFLVPFLFALSFTPMTTFLIVRIMLWKPLSLALKLWRTWTDPPLRCCYTKSMHWLWRVARNSINTKPCTWRRSLLPVPPMPTMRNSPITQSRFRRYASACTSLKSKFKAYFLALFSERDYGKVWQSLAKVSLVLQSVPCPVPPPDLS